MTHRLDLLEDRILKLEKELVRTNARMDGHDKSIIGITRNTNILDGEINKIRNVFSPVKVKYECSLEIKKDFANICNSLRIDPILIRSSSRKTGLVARRWVVAQQLADAGWTPTEIAAVMHRERTAVIYMLKTEEEREIKRAQGRGNS